MARAIVGRTPALVNRTFVSCILSLHGSDQPQSLDPFSETARCAAFAGARMSGKKLDDSSISQRNPSRPARDSRGRWVRRSPLAETIAAPDSGLDERIVEGVQPPPAEERLPRRECAEHPAGGVFDAVAAAEPSEKRAASAEAGDTVAPEIETEAAHVSLESPTTEAEAEALLPWPAPAPSWRSRSRPSLLIVGALLLFGAVYLVVRHGSSGTKRAGVAAPPQPSTIVATAAAPAVPTPAAQRPTTQVAATPPHKNEASTATAGASIVIPPAPLPAPTAPNPAAQTDPVASGATPSRATLDEDGLFKQADAYLLLGDDKRAEALYRRLLDAGTQKGRAALALGDLLAKKNDFDHARVFYRASKRYFQDSDQPPSPP
jgi:TolA-binding protein